MDFLARWKGYSEQTDEKLREYLSDKALLPELAEAMAYSVFAGGKRLRPALCLGAAALFDGACAISAACALEMIHTYSLIHDDLPAMDDDTMRRGRATSHVVFGEAQAILAGDALLNYAFEIMLNCPHTDKPNYIKAVALIAGCAGAKGMIAGQAKDVMCEKSPDPNCDKQAMLEYIHAHKTGALIKAAVLSGAMIGGSSDRELIALDQYASNLGLAFQIVDDILDATGDSAEVGKSLGKDASSGKLTFISVYGLEESKRLAKSHTESAVAALDGLGERAEFLREMAQFMLNRSY